MLKCSRLLPVLKHPQFIFFIYVYRRNFTPKIILLDMVEFGYLDSKLEDR